MAAAVDLVVVAVSEQTFSPHWYRVAELRPRLRPHATLHRQRYRGQTWFLLQDGAATRYHRYTASAHSVIGQMDGRVTVQEIWERAMTELGDGAPTQDEAIELLGALYRANLIQCDAPPDARELLERRGREQRRKLIGWLANPLSQRIPLVNPGPLVERCLPAARIVFGVPGVVLWVLVIGYALSLAATHWPELRASMDAELLTSQRVALLVFAYLVVKTLHELGHAFVTRIGGGEVREMGVMMLVLMPVPYVDASASAVFPSKYRRMAVGAAGILVEVFLAAVGLAVWANVEPGLVRDAALTVMLVGGVSTLLFNGNPLLKFDGYHVLADWIEIPNLAARSNKYIAYLVKRYAFGLEEAENPATAPGERPWFVGYGLAAATYRLAIMVTIVFYIVGKFFVVGMILAAWYVTTQIALPLAKRVRYLVADPALSRHRLRAVGLVSVTLAATVSGLCLVPVPVWTHAEGVVWLPEDAHLRAAADGFVTRVRAAPHSPVRSGDAVLETEHPTLRAELGVLEAKLSEVRAHHAAELRRDRVRAKIVADDVRAIEADLARAREESGSLVIRAPADGAFVAATPQDLEGRFVRQGEVVGYVVERTGQRIRAVVSQNDLARVRLGTTGVRAVFVDRPWETLRAEVAREVPAAQYLLPSPALGTHGGGRIPVERDDKRGLKALEKVFQFELELPDYSGEAWFGERVYVRFDHGREPLADQGLRYLRQLLLSRFGV